MSQPSKLGRILLSLATALSLGIVIVISTAKPALAVGGQERVAYYGNWDIYGNSYFLKDVAKTGAAAQLTTLMYSFENIDPTSLRCFQATHPVDVSESNPNGGDGGGDAWGDYQRPFPASESVSGQADSASQPLRGSFNQLKQLKARYPNLKVVLSIGGWTFSKFFSDAAASPASRANLVSSCIDMYIRGNLPTGVSGDTTAGGPGVAKGIFDGIDIDWEFPAGSDGQNTGHLGNHASANDASNYVALLAEFRRQLDAQGSADGKHYYLTAAVEAGANGATLGKASQIQSYLDWAGVMTYDMHGAWESHGPTNFQAPLYPSLIDPAAGAHLSVDEAMKRWQNAGVPLSKLVAGVPFYWRGWSGVPSANNGLYQSATGGSPAYPITNQAGVAHYKELLKAGKVANLHYDNVTHSPWIYNSEAGGSFYTGDTPQTLTEKGAYIRGSGYRGAMVYSLEGDDASGTLLKSLSRGLNGGAPAPVPSVASVIAEARTSVSSANTATNGEPINMIGGNFLATRHELQLPNRDNPVDFALSYNSVAADQIGRVGWGWTDSYRITALTDTDGSIVVQNPDGRLDRFTPDGGGGYTPPSGLFDTLTVGNGQVRVTHKDHSVYDFNGNGLIGSIDSANGNTIMLTYDTDARLTTVTDSANRSLQFTYKADNLLASVADASGRTVRYDYDELGDLHSVTNPAGQTTKYEYDLAHRLTKITDPRGHDVVINTYDDPGRVTKQVNGLSHTVSLSYAAGQTTFTDANGGQTVYSYDSQLRVTSVKDALGGTSTSTYDAAGSLYKTTDPLGHVTSRLYDARGNLTQLTDPAGRIQKFSFDAEDNLLSRTDQLARTTSYAYDSHGNVTKKTDAAGNTTTFSYDTAGQLTAVADPLSNVTKFAYDTSGNLVTKTDASSRDTYFGYDASGRLTSVEDADHNQTVFALDAMDRITKVTNPDGDVTAALYDGDGNRTKLTDANGHATTFQYNANNNLTKTINALSQGTAYSYDKNGNLTTVTDAKGRTKRFSYNLLDRQTKQTDALGNVTKATYDKSGNLLTRTDASNRTTGYSYDQLDRLTKITYPDGTTATYSFDAVGNVLKATSPSGTVTHTYDRLDRVTSVKDPHGAVVTYSYSAADELRQVKYPDGKLVSYTYTPAKQLSTVKDWTGATTTYLYDNEGRVAVKKLPNSIKATYSYDANGRLSDLVYTKGTSKLTSFSYARDAAGNITEDNEIKADGTQRYSAYAYDALDQITLDDAPAHTWKYRYDAAGSMSSSLTDGTTTSMTYNAANQLLTRGSRTFAYDKQGNEIKNGSKTLAYDFDNRLKSFTSAGFTTRYVYDATGNRIEKNGTTKYQYVNAGNNNVLVTKNITRGTSTYNLFGNDLISQGGAATSSRQYFLTDGLGNVKYLTNSSGTILNTYSYDPFGGNQTTSGGTTNSYLYQAEQKDAESGLIFLRARYYDPSIARFTGVDPLSGAADDPRTQNGYSYSDNNPANLSDPTGLWAITDCYSASVTVLHFTKAVGICFNLGGDGYSVTTTGSSGIETGRFGASAVNTLGFNGGRAQDTPQPTLDATLTRPSGRLAQYSASISRSSDGALSPSVGFGIGVSDKKRTSASISATASTRLNNGSWSQLGHDWYDTIFHPTSILRGLGLHSSNCSW